MSTFTITILVIISLIGFIVGGYFLWKYSKEKYNFNIFNTWIIIRGFIGSVAILVSIMAFFGLLNPENSIDSGFYLLFGLGILLFIWNFIVTAKNTTFLIAIMAFIYQLIAIYIIKLLVKKALNFFGY